MGSRIASPCVGLCSTTLGDPVCRGCQRSDDEISQWLALSSAQRDTRMAELDDLRSRVAGRLLRIEDEARLEAQMRRYRIRFRPEQPALSRVVELLRVGRDRIRDLSCYGVTPLPGVAGLSPSELHRRLSEQLQEEARARWRNGQAPSIPPECSRL